jgi:uncharacterized protein
MVPVTALYGALNAIFNILLAFRVTELRKRHKTSHGDADDPRSPLALGIRAHGNNAEYVPLGLVMLLIVELCGGERMWLHILGGTFLVARVLHPIGLPLKSPNVYRWLGVALTFAVIGGAAGYALYLHFKLI